jgi:hypothetical protein
MAWGDGLSIYIIGDYVDFEAGRHENRGPSLRFELGNFFWDLLNTYWALLVHANN